MRAIITALTGSVVLAMMVGGATDYAAYERMPDAERAKLRFGHQLRPSQSAPADDIEEAAADAPAALPTDTAE